MDSARRRSPLAVALIVIVAVVALAATAGATNHFLISKSSEVKDGALQARDLSKKARAKLRGNRGPRGRRGRRGATGPTGPTGLTGPAGADGTNGTNGAPGVQGERGPSNAFTVHKASINTPACPAGGCTSAPRSVIANLSLPAGSFVVTASAYLAPFAAQVDETNFSIECHLDQSGVGTIAKLLHAYEAPSGGVPDQSVQLDTAITLSTAATLSLDCSFGAINFTAGQPRITAIQVGSLSDTVF